MSTSLLFDIGLLVVLAVVGVLLFRVTRRKQDGDVTGRGYYPTLARQAGYDPEGLRGMYWGSKIVLALLLPLLAGNLLGAWPKAFVVLPLAVLGFFLPDLLLTMKKNSRKTKILTALSFYLDLVVSFLRSGLTLEESVNRAAVRGLPPNHPLAEEVKLVAEEIGAGRDRAAAFSALARRTRISDLHAVASALELGSRLGFPVADVLATQADVQREKRAERGRRRIDRAGIVALFPVLLCGFPLFTLVVIVPIVVKVFDTFKMIKGLL